jgi:hypothetical protein
MDRKLELVVVPVVDVDRAKAFYSAQIGFNVDVDPRAGDHFRVVQLTPPGFGVLDQHRYGDAAGPARLGAGHPPDRARRRDHDVRRVDVRRLRAAPDPVILHVTTSQPSAILVS